MNKFNRHYVVLAILSAFYTVITLITPAQKAVLTRYNVDSGQITLLKLTIVIPAIVIWLCAFYGFIRIKEYAEQIRESKDGIAFTKIANGLAVLVYGLPIAAAISSYFNYIEIKRPDLTPVLTIYSNYVTLLLTLIGFYTIYQGTRLLVGLLGKSSMALTQRGKLLMFGFMVFSAIYAYITITNPYRNAVSPISNRAAYYLPDFILILTIIIPYIVLWYWGFSAAYNIYEYKKKVKGILYQNAVKQLAQGLGAVVVSSMAVRYFVSMTSFSNNLNLRLLLLLIYILLIVISIGYIFIALGAKKLKLLEEA